MRLCLSRIWCRLWLAASVQICNALHCLPAGIPDTPAARREQLAVLDSHIEWLQDAEKQQNHDVALRDKSMDARQQQLSGLEHSISKERHSAVSTAALQLLSRKQSQVRACRGPAWPCVPRSGPDRPVEPCQAGWPALACHMHALKQSA